MYLIQIKTSLVRSPTGTFTNNEVIQWQHIVNTNSFGVEKLLSAATCRYRPVALEKRRVDMLAVPHVPKQHNQNNRHVIKTTQRARRTQNSASFGMINLITFTHSKKKFYLFKMLSLCMPLPQTSECEVDVFVECRRHEPHNLTFQG